MSRQFRTSNAAALTCLDDRMTRHMKNPEDTTPSAERAYTVMSANHLMESGRQSRIGGGVDDYILSSRNETLVISSLAALPSPIKLLRRKAKHSPDRTLMEWLLRQPASAYPLIVYIQSKGSGAGLAGLRLSHDPSAVHYCGAKEHLVIDLNRIRRSIDLIESMPITVQTYWTEVVRYLLGETLSGTAMKRITLWEAAMKGDWTPTHILPRPFEPEYNLLRRLIYQRHDDKALSLC